MYIGMLRAVEEAPSNTTRHPPHTLTHSTGCELGKNMKKAYTYWRGTASTKTTSFYVATDLKELL